MSAMSPERPARLVALAFATTVAVSSLGFALTACESATNLDVKYDDAGAALEGSKGDAEGGPVAPGLPTLPGCPCDETAGLGCCMPAVGTPFCTIDRAVCAAAMGTHLGCVGPDPRTESVCCWHPDTKPGATTALASVCDGGVAACQTNGDCAGTGKPCTTTKCFGGTITIGACATAPPTCPQP